MVNSGIEYEKTVQAVSQEIVNFRRVGLESIVVHHNEVLTGISGVTHQIDVLWDFKIGDFLYRTLIEVKNWKSSVKQEQLMAFHSVLKDIPGQPRGIFVSKSGFQSGAIVYAKTHGIDLLIINEDRALPFCINTSFFEHYNTLDVQFIAKDTAQQTELSTICNSQAVFSEKINMIDPCGNVVSANWLIEHAEEEQQQTPEQQAYFHRQKDNSEAHKICQLSLVLHEGWGTEHIDMNRHFSIIRVDVSYEIWILKIPVNISVSRLPKYIVENLITREKTVLRQTTEGLHICEDNEIE